MIARRRTRAQRQATHRHTQAHTHTQARARAEARRSARSQVSALFAALVLTVFAVVLGFGGACAGTRACRSGTLFLTVRLGSFSDADSLILDVTVAGSSSRHSVLPLSGATAGGIEIAFPSGYPAGKTISIVAELDKANASLARRSASVLLPSGCGALVVDFGAADAGNASDVPVDSHGGDGNGGDGNGGGDAAVDGGTGSGGAGGGGGGASGGRGGGAGATGGAGGRGMIGSGGRGGAGGGGVTGTGGAASGGQSGATGGGSGGSCVPTGTVENCYNGIDDDCNGRIDCTDPACQSPAVCVALDGGLGALGTALGAGSACPAEAGIARNLMSGLSGTACAGCSCGGGSTIACEADLYAFSTASACSDTTQAGAFVHTLTAAEGCVTPSWATVGGSIFGVGTPLFRGTPGGVCLAIGVPRPGDPTWAMNSRFCAVPSVGGGCGAGAACVPRNVAATGACLLMDGARACPIGTRQTSWFTGLSDSRACSACTCGTPTGGDCGSMIIGIGSDFTCEDPPSNGYLRNASRTCFSGPGVYSPGVQFVGTPISPTCQPLTTQSGTLAGSGPETLCCL